VVERMIKNRTIAEVGKRISDALDFGGERDAIDNLEGALIDLRRTGADPVCIRTVERVQQQIAAVLSIISTKSN
jgi:hypothetical protein